MPKALAAIQADERNVQSCRHACSMKYRIPKSTLYDHVRDISKRELLAINCVLTKSEEEIVSTCKFLQLMGFSTRQGASKHGSIQLPCFSREVKSINQWNSRRCMVERFSSQVAMLN